MVIFATILIVNSGLISDSSDLITGVSLQLYPFDEGAKAAHHDFDGLSLDSTAFGNDKASANFDDGVRYSDPYASMTAGNSMLLEQSADWLQHFETTVRDLFEPYMQFDSGNHIAYADDTELPRPFITTWNITSSGQSITIPVGGATGQYTVDWGDGSQETVTGNVSHQYSDAGTYTVSISGDFTRISLGDDYSNAQKLQSIQQWGDIQWGSMNNAFAGASNMVYNATDVPILSGVTDMSNMFIWASSFDGDISSWDVSGVTDMSGMFLRASSFNSDLNSWDVSGAINMRSMFENAASFNSDLNSWDVSGVTDMSYIFSLTNAFDGDISSWDVSGVTNMNGLFWGAAAFDGDISSWDVSGVTEMDDMFHNNDAFDGDISSWDVSGVATMGGMFSNSTFDGDISSWDVSGVTHMSGMFQHADAFNGDISSWDVSGVTNMQFMFYDADAFNGDISSWDVSGVTNMRDMLSDADAFDQNLGKWYIVLDDYSIDDGDTDKTVTRISTQNTALGNSSPTYSIASSGDGDAFEIVGSELKLKSVPNYAAKSSYTVTILYGGGFGTSNSVTFDIFVDPTILTPAPFITTWTTTTANESITIPVGGATGQYAVDWGDGSHDTVTGNAFHRYSDAGTYTVRISGDFTRISLGDDSSNAQKLQSIQQWGDIRWSSMNNAFAYASNMVYNATDVPDIFNVADMQYMFRDASSFNSDLNSWNVSSVTDMQYMFRGASSFNSDLSSWDVSGVTSMRFMFLGASSFNSDLSSWDVSGVTSMRFMFLGASSFNSDLSSWDVSGVTDMQYMFYGASSLNSDLSSWDVSGVTDMRSMFYGASSLNSDLSSWDVSGVTDMRSMFDGADAFDQNLGKWYIVLDDYSIDDGDTDKTVTRISAQNTALGNSSPTYSIASSDDGDAFEIVGSELKLKSVPNYAAKSSYTVTILSSGGFGTSNSVTFNISVDPTILTLAPFITTWTTTTANESIKIPVGGATGQYDVDWGDGSHDTVTGNAFHRYSDAGTYTVRISGDFTRISLGDDRSSAQKLQSIQQWGDIRWSSMNYAFAYASNMVYNATDVPILSDVNDMSAMFIQASSFDGDISSWNVSGVTTMHSMFYRASSFNSDLSSWDVSGVTTMHSMFYDASSFNSDLSSWDVSGVTYIHTMFYGASSFTSDLSSWDVSGVTDMRFMFLGASSFNSDLSSWNVSGVTTMYSMFSSASSFNSDLSSWNVSGVTTMHYMFFGASSFNSDLSSWDVSGVTNMRSMFLGASSFNSDLSSWDVSGVTTMHSMFDDASSFNSDLSSWDVSGVTSMRSMFYDASSFNSDLSSWDVSGVTDMHSMFRDASSFNLDLSSWNVSGVTTMHSMFYDASSFNSDLSSWDVSGVTTMHSMFYDASSFNSDLSSWDVSGVTDMHSMFFGASSFNSDLSSWDVSGVTDMHNMFYRASSFNSDLSSWDVSGVTTMHSMFYRASSFNSDLSSWDVSGVTTMHSMFYDASSFNSDLSSWDVSGVTYIHTMFYGASSFTSDLSSWDVSGVTDMRFMFLGASSFNSDLSSWNVSGVTTMYSMFSSASSFNSDLSSWNVSGVTTMHYMFFGASSFNSDLSSWDVSGVTNMRSMFLGASSFNSDLSSWNVSGVTTMHSMFDDASSFNSDLSSWDVSGVTSMRSMFYDASSFNSDLSSWDVSGVTDMYSMFSGASSFNSDLSSWDVSGVTYMYSMFSGASSFNSDLSSWDVSGVTDMRFMFSGADAFDQNLGEWYIVLSDQSIDDGDASRTVASISTQNPVLAGQSPTYSISSGDDGNAFEIVGSDLKLKSVPNHAAKNSYTVTILSSGGFGTSNSVTFEILVISQNISYDLVAEFNTLQRFSLMGVGVDNRNGDIYVSSSYNDHIDIYDSAGTYIDRYMTQGRSFGYVQTPVDIEIDSVGNIIIADSGNARIQVLTSFGNYTISTGDRFSGSEGIDIDDSGNIYVAVRDKIQIYNYTGSLQREFGEYGRENGQFSNPADVAVGPLGNIYVADNNNERIQIFDPTGTFLSKFSISSGSWLESIDVDSNGNIAVVGGPNAYIYDSSGNVIDVINAGLNSPTWVKV